jgi:RNA polymerase sigma-70 factor (ECF subfamily)
LFDINMNDADLVTRAQAGDADAIGTLYDRHHRSIFQYISTRVREQKLAQDITGDVFTKMIMNLPNYQVTEVPFQAWLYRISYNLIVDHYRKGNGHMLLPLEQVEHTHTDNHNLASIVEKQLTLECVQAALDQIDPVQRDVITLRFLAGLSLNEVAQILKKSVASVKSLQHRGLKALRIALEEV